LLCLGDDVKYTVAEALNNGMPANRAIKLNSETETAELLIGKLQKGSTVLFKASRGMHFENIVQKIWPDLGKNLH
jgi:UDP-N-acetylmuramyl pentapeptide synthase